MHHRRISTLVIVAGLALGAVAPGIATTGYAQEMAGAQEDLPISSITLYRSGVGYFQRRGMIEDDGSIQLRFATDQINDILKSMVLLDLDGGQIEAASYGSKEPLARRLASFAVDISQNPSQGDLLNQLRGARVRIEMPERPLEGVVLGVEQRRQADGDVEITASYVNIMSGSGVRAIDLTQISGFEIIDRDLANELERALAALAEHRADNTKTVDLGFRGEGARRVVVGYVHEMPVWKTSYRLVLPEDETEAGAGGEPTIQGWAIVENTTDEDWENVKLALVAGRPVGFQMDLYEPLFITRPYIPVPVLGGVMPKAYEADVAEEAQFAAKAMSPRRGRAPASAGLAFRDSNEAIEADDMVSYAAQAQASAAEVGEVFQYQLDAPVTLERRRSAMLPILSAGIEGRRVSIYNTRDQAKHPMRGVELTNTSGLQLMPGPISVFDGAAYAGDAQIGHVSAGDQRLLAYSVDLDVKAMTETNSNRRIMSIRVVDGVIEQTTRQRIETTYRFDNADNDRPRTILTEHPKRSGWDLITPESPDSETDSLFRFELELPPGGDGATRVTQERVDRERLELVSFDLGTLLRYERDGRVSPKVVAAVREARRIQQLVLAAERRERELEKERQDIAADQSRVRENMARIDRNSDLYGRYIRKLDDQETRIEQIASQIEDARAEVVTRRNELAAYLRGLKID